MIIYPVRYDLETQSLRFMADEQHNHRPMSAYVPPGQITNDVMRHMARVWPMRLSAKLESAR